MLDTFNEKRRAFSFLLNPAGVQMDMMRVEEGGNDNMDDSWDTVFLSDGKVDAEGYTVEAAIPFKSLRFPNDDVKTWNIVLGRNLPRTGEIIMHPTYSRDIPGLLSNGRPFIIQGAVERSRNVEVMPFVTSLYRGNQEPSSTGERFRRTDVQPGANFKLGLSSNTTLDLTANPDFSQIEADEPQIDYNLRYALRYNEKRPFFLEGMEIFSSPEIETVYTRQISDPIFGAKASGKSGRFTYGLLSAYDMHPTESLWEIPSGGTATGTKAFSNVFRTKADVGFGLLHRLDLDRQGARRRQLEPPRRHRRPAPLQGPGLLQLPGPGLERELRGRPDLHGPGPLRRALLHDQALDASAATTRPSTPISRPPWASSTGRTTARSAASPPTASTPTRNTSTRSSSGSRPGGPTDTPTARPRTPGSGPRSSSG